MARPHKPTDRPKSIRQVNAAIREKHDGLRLANGNGYFYFYSDNQELGVALASITDGTSVMTARVSNLTFKQWVAEADEIMKKVRF